MQVDEITSYSAMFYFLSKYWKTTSSEDVAVLLGGLNVPDGEALPVDRGYWQEWLKALEEAQRNPLPIQVSNQEKD